MQATDLLPTFIKVSARMTRVANGEETEVVSPCLINPKMIFSVAVAYSKEGQPHGSAIFFCERESITVTESFSEITEMLPYAALDQKGDASE